MVHLLANMKLIVLVNGSFTWKYEAKISDKKWGGLTSGGRSPTVPLYLANLTQEMSSIIY